MNRNAPVLTADLLLEALAVPQATKAPADLRSSISARLDPTEQRPPSLAVRVTSGFDALPRRLQLAAVFLVVAALILSAALVGSWLLEEQRRPLGDSPTYRGDAGRTGLSHDAGPGTALTAAWRVQLPDQVVTSPAIAGGVAYVPVLDGTLRAFDLDDGRELWRADVGASFSSPSIAAGVVLLGTDNRELVAVDRATGGVAWRIPLDGFAAGSPAVVGSRGFIATSSDEVRGRHDPRATGSVIAVDLATHSILWQEALPGPSTQSIAAASNVVVAPTDAGIAVAYDQDTGAERWRTATGVFMDTPVIARDRVFLAGLDLEGTKGALSAIDLDSGRTVWTYRRPNGQTVFAPAVDLATGIAYTGAVDGDLVALRIDDGTVVGSFATGHEVAAAVTLASGVAYVPTLDGIVAVDVRARTVADEFRTDGIPFTPAVAEAALVAGTTGGTLLHLVAADAAHAPASPTPAVDALPSSRPPASQQPISRPLREVWERSGAQIGLDNAAFINGAPDGNVWVADAPRGRFVIVNPEGAVVDTWQPTGDAALDLVQPDADRWGAVAFLADGSFVVADTDHQRVVRFDATRHLMSSWGEFGSGPGQFVSPFGITAGPDGLIYVVDDVTCRVEVFDRSGTYIRTVAGTSDLRNSCTNNVVVDRDGTVYLASGGRGTPWRISVYDSRGTLVRRVGEGVLREPVLLARGPDGGLYASDGTERLDLFDRGGSLVSSWTAPGLEMAVIGPENAVYVPSADGGLRRYQLP